jgi:hypothetical protein
MDQDEYEEKLAEYMEIIYEEGHTQFEVPGDVLLKPEQQNFAATMLMAAAVLRMGHQQERQHKLMIEAIHKLAGGLEGFAHSIYDAIKAIDDDG